MALKKETLQKGISLYDPNFIPAADADRFFTALNKLDWKQHIKKMYGKDISMPRMYQWMGIAPILYLRQRCSELIFIDRATAAIADWRHSIL